MNLQIQQGGVSATNIDRLMQHPILRELGAAGLQQVVAASRLVSLRPKRRVLEEGTPSDTVYFLLSGSVRVYHRDPKGNEALLKLLKAPAVFGEMEALAHRPMIEYVTTLDYCDLLYVPADVFRATVAREPRFSAALMVDLALRLCIAAQNVKALAFSDVQRRLANLLVDYAELCGRPHREGLSIPIRLSQEQLAHDLAVSRKALAGALNNLRAAGLVGKYDARFVVRDLAGLRERGVQVDGLVFNSKGLRQAS